MSLDQPPQFRPHCLSCRTVAGLLVPPGGILYTNPYWLVCLRAKPLLIPGQGVIILKRHCEHLSELTDEELTTLGPTLKQTTQVLTTVLKPVRVHIGLYAEEVRHLHLHVLPRTQHLPAGNIPVTLLELWYRLLARAGIRPPYPDAEVEGVAARLRAEFQRLSGQSAE
jgi:diadenosine tetraphosphate (Ap4A) HIT family hydrolase